jgi:hypothetical protein
MKGVRRIGVQRLPRKSIVLCCHLANSKRSGDALTRTSEVSCVVGELSW